MGLVGRSLSIFGLVRTSNMPTAAEVGLTRIQSARPQPPTRDESDLAARLRSAAASPNWRPAMPPRAALEMLAVYRNPDVTFVELTEILERDAALAARVLRVASSPLYSPRQPPNSLHTAAVRLGLKTLTSIVWECAMNARIFHAEPYESAMERLSQHSTAVARIARTIARAVDEDGETAYLAGLLHDIGIGAGLALAAQARPDERASLEVVEGALALCHEEIGDLLAGAWQLPTSLSAALAYHHEPPPAGPRLSLIIALADRLASEAGFAVSGTDETSLDQQSVASTEDAADALGLSPSMLELLVGSAGGLAFDSGDGPRETTHGTI